MASIAILWTGTYEDRTVHGVYWDKATALDALGRAVLDGDVFERPTIEEFEVADQAHPDAPLPSARVASAWRALSGNGRAKVAARASGLASALDAMAFPMASGPVSVPRGWDKIEGGHEVEPEGLALPDGTEPLSLDAMIAEVGRWLKMMISMSPADARAFADSMIDRYDTSGSLVEPSHDEKWSAIDAEFVEPDRDDDDRDPIEEADGRRTLAEPEF